MSAYYNDCEPYVCAWLRNLIAAGHIAPGEVDERDIWDVRPDDLRGFQRVHLFAGVAVWSYALRCAGWDDDRPVWTISCPCQPFSAAGKRGGFADERHLWPAAFHLINALKPDTVFGEQVASPDGLAWLDVVWADLAGAGYAVGAVDLPACGVGAPHIRQRLFFVADAGEQRRQQVSGGASGDEATDGRQPDGDHESTGGSPARLVAESASARCDGAGQHGCGPPPLPARSEQRRGARIMADAERAGRAEGRAITGDGQAPSGGATGELGDAEGEDGSLPVQPGQPREAGAQSRRPGPVNSFWRDAEWIPCRDGKARPVEPGTFPLATGIANRVGRLRAYGNCLAAPAAEAVIRAYMGTKRKRK